MKSRLIEHYENLGCMNRSSNRIEAIDFAKGMLVLLMVVYHALNYLGYDSLPHEYMVFLPMSFIMIAGFLVMQVYSGRQGPQLARVAPRLALRALKLLLLFTALNLTARAMWSHNHYGVDLSVKEFVTNWYNVYVTAQAKGVAFDVLVPISYTLALSIGVLAMRAVMPSFPVTLAVLAIVVCGLFDFAGRPIYSVQFIGAGVIGLALGTVDLRKINRCVGSWALLFALFASNLVTFFLKLDNFLTQIFATISSLAILYAVGRVVNPVYPVVRQICLLGRYSLLSYIVQILFLQGANGINGLGLTSNLTKAIVVISVVTALTWCVVWLVELGRANVRGVDRLYKGVFA